jgi:hypothetical protein
LDKIVGLADFMMCKYADKKEMRSILKHFTSIINDTANSLGDFLKNLILKKTIVMDLIMMHMKQVQLI